MDTDTPQPRKTKEWLIEDGLRGLTAEDRRDAARDLLLGVGVLPDRWMTAEQRAFLALGPRRVPKSAIRHAGADLVARTVSLCDRLIPRLVDDYLDHRDLDPAARAGLRRVAPAVVGRTLFVRCRSWPAADIAGVEFDIRLAVYTALDEERARQMPDHGEGGLVVRPDQRPADRLDWNEKLTTRATSTESMLVRHNRFLWGQEARGAFRVATALVATAAMAVLYVLLFCFLSYLEPTLTAREALTVVSSAVGAALGGTGLGLLGQVIRSRFGRRRPGDDPPAAPRPGATDPARPEPR